VTLIYASAARGFVRFADERSAPCEILHPEFLNLLFRGTTSGPATSKTQPLFPLTRSAAKRHFVMPVTQADISAQYVGNHRRSGGPSTEDLSWPAIPAGFFGS
jgi:hypothetical protein